MIKVLIVDDHLIVREGLKQILSKEAAIEVAGEAANCREALLKIKENSFDVVLLDIKMPDMLGLDIIGDILKLKPGLPILMLSSYPEEQYAMVAIKSGAYGYLVKESLPKELIHAILEVNHGRKYISSSLALRMADYLQTEGEQVPHERLSSREFQIMCMLASGKRVCDIGSELFISVKTVSTHRTRALEKMGMESNMEFARYAVKHGLVS